MKTSLLLLIALILALSVFASASIVAPKKHSPGKTCKSYAWSAFKCKASKEICKAWKRHPRKCIGHEKIPICKKWKHRKGQCKKVKTFTKCKWEKKSKQVCKKVRVPYTKQFTKCSRTGKRHCKKFHHYKKCNKYKKTYKCVKYAKKIIKIRVCKKITKKHRKIVKKESKHKKHSKKHHRRHHKKHPKKRCFIKKIVKINKKKCLKRKCTGKKCCSWVTKRGKCKVWSKRKLVCKKYTKKLFKIVNKCKTVHYRKCHKFTFKKCVCRYKKNKCAIKIYKKGKCNKWKKGKKYCARKAKVCVKRCQFAKCGAKPKRD